MNFIRIGKKALNLDQVTYAEAQVWQDEMSVKVYFVGSANNAPVVFAENEPRNYGSTGVRGGKACGIASPISQSLTSPPHKARIVYAPEWPSAAAIGTSLRYSR